MQKQHHNYEIVLVRAAAKINIPSQDPKFEIIVMLIFFCRQESVINAQINPELNKRWAEDLEKGEVDKEIELIISRSRENSIVNQLKEKGAFDVRFEAGDEPQPSGDPSPVGRTRRSNSLATVSELPRRNRSRTRTVSYSPQVCTLWIGH